MLSFAPVNFSSNETLRTLFAALSLSLATSLWSAAISTAGPVTAPAVPAQDIIMSVYLPVLGEVVIVLWSSMNHPGLRYKLVILLQEIRTEVQQI
jgi:hypothetical protein